MVEKEKKILPKTTMQATAYLRRLITRREEFDGGQQFSDPGFERLCSGIHHAGKDVYRVTRVQSSAIQH